MIIEPDRQSGEYQQSVVERICGVWAGPWSDGVKERIMDVESGNDDE